MSDQYAISIHSSRLPLPLSVAVHAYIVIECNHQTDRFDLIRPGSFEDKSPYDGRIFKNILHPYVGFRVFAYLKNIGICWNTTEHSKIRGGTGSVAHQLYDFIANEGLRTYPFKEAIHYDMFRGPNSNTFAAWVVNQFPEAKLRLPWNAWGKGFKIRD